jgi:beta-lactamase class A
MLPLALAALMAHQPSAVSGAIEVRLRQRIAASGAEVAVAVRTLDGTVEVLIDPDRSFHAASTMKVPVMIELFRQVRAGLVSLADAIPVRNEFRSIVDGSPYSLDEADDSDRVVHAAIGTRMTLGDLCEAMITVSSNLAANLLVERLGIDNIRATVARLGADRNGGMQVRRGVEDGKAFEKGLNNTTTARGLLTIFDSLGHGRAVDGAADEAMLAILKRQQFNDAIPAGLPSGTPVAHKTGDITRINHDAGIVYGPRPYVIVLLVRGIDDRTRSASLMADLSRVVYEGIPPG